MKKNGWLFAGAIVTTLIAAGCAHHVPMTPPRATLDCMPDSHGLCRIEIAVSPGCKTMPSKVVVDPIELRMPPNLRGRATVIQWKIVTPGWQFQQNPEGIRFKEPGAPFSKHPNPHGPVWTHVDLGTTPGKFAYEVNVTGGPPDNERCTLDPTIFNDW